MLPPELGEGVRRRAATKTSLVGSLPGRRRWLIAAIGGAPVLPPELGERVLAALPLRFHLLRAIVAEAAHLLDAAQFFGLLRRVPQPAARKPLEQRAGVLRFELIEERQDLVALLHAEGRGRAVEDDGPVGEAGWHGEVPLGIRGSGLGARQSRC